MTLPFGLAAPGHPLPRFSRACVRWPLAFALSVGGAALAQPVPPAENATATPAFAPTWGLVLDGSVSAHDIALGSRAQGLTLGGAELTVESPLGPWLRGRVNLSGSGTPGDIKASLEEAWLETTALPGGWQARGGRFMSQIGYLNEQHPHTDDFAERPLLHRAFLGEQYGDNGVRLNWIAPTDLYWRTGIEVFGGRALTPGSGARSADGVWTLSTKLGGDVGHENSWQAGVSYLRNRRAGFATDAGNDDGALYQGHHLWMLDAVWKWAPNGNNRDRQLRLSAEWARQTGFGPGVRGGSNSAAYLAAVWRFGGQWEVGARTDWLRAMAGSDNPARLRENSLMLAWKPSHQQTLRLQVARQSGALGITSGHTVLLQYIISFGAHGAHSY